MNKLKMTKINKLIFSTRQIVKLYDMHATIVNISKRSNKFPFSLYKKPYRNLFIKFLQPKRNEKILDLGCGDGFNLDLLSKLSSTTIGLDISSKRLSRCNGEVWRIRADARHLPFKPTILDKILMADVLEHLTHPKDTLKECYRVLRRDGILVISIPTTFGDLLMKLGSLLPFSLFMSEKFTAFEHIWHFDVKKLKSLLRECGFEVRVCKKHFTHLVPINTVFLAVKR